MANQKINGGASPYPKHVGPSAICSFSDGADGAPLKTLVFSIEPKQSGSGDPSPQNIRPITGWTQVDGKQAGKNLVDVKTYDGTVLGSLHVVSDGKGVITAQGTSTQGWQSNLISKQILLPPGTYKVSAVGSGTYPSGSVLTVGVEAALGYSFDSGSGYCSLTSTEISKTVTFTISKNTAINYGLWFAAGTFDATFTFQIERDTATSFEPATLTPITIALGQTVYGGTVDALAGKCYARPYYASYSGQALVGPWISSHDKYVSGGTPTTGAQVVDMGGAVTEISVTAQQVSSLLGQNNIWANTGDTELDYYPAQSSVVAVWDRTRHIYASIPLSAIRYDTYQINPQQAIDLDSYRSETGTLIRNVVGSKAKIEFNTPMMDDSQWAEVWSILSAGFNNTNEKKLKLKYYDTQSGSYKYGYFYVPDVQTPIRSIDEPNGIINYNEIRIAFIEY